MRRMQDLQKLQQDLKDTRQEVRNLVVISLWPNLLPAEVELVKSLERSARAEVRLRVKHLRWLQAQPQE
jgi:hypothetical protein